MGVAAFATDIRAALAGHLAPAAVSFRGSIARGRFDELSDVDLEAAVGVPLDGPFFAGLSEFLAGRYGPALVRYDPDLRTDPAAQGLRISFRSLPVFWRVDLDLRSSAHVGAKWPDPFPAWDVGTSAVMNLLWAVKCRRRGDPAADGYVASACDKLGLPRRPYSPPGVRSVLAALRGRSDVDAELLAAVAGAAEARRAELSGAAWLRACRLPSGPADCLTRAADAVATVGGAGGWRPPAE